MSILELFGNKLQAAGVGLLGKTVFLNSMPLQCEQGVLLRDTHDGLVRDWELPGTRTGALALIARAHRYPDAVALAQRAADALTVLAPESAGTILLHYARPANDPVPYPDSNGRFTEAAVRIDLCFVL